MKRFLLLPAAAAVLLTLLFRIPKIGPALRGLFSLAILAFGFFLILQQAPFDPNLSRVSERLGLDRQEVPGQEVRIRMSPDGHFWAHVRVGGVGRRMLIDSGATLTALSSETAAAAGLKTDDQLFPVVLNTANGAITARTATLPDLRLGDIIARDLPVVVSPAFGDTDVLGMNFLSMLESRRVEGRTLVLVPHHPQATSEGIDTVRRPL